MRLVSYNILDGGEGRADPLAEVVLAQRPDVVGLVEADDPEVVRRIARRLSMDYVFAPGKPGRSGREKTSALLSGFPIVSSLNHGRLRPELTKSFVMATLRTPGGGEIDVGVVHLHARAGRDDEQIRLREIDALLDITAPLRNDQRPHILMGDFNANSPVQQIDLGRCKPRTREDAQANEGLIPREVMSRLLACGYIDTLAAFDPDAARHACTFTTQHPGQRVDYILAFGIRPPQVTWAHIEHDRLAKYASDHFPVAAEIAL